jgi:protein-S-isoprenylcysteine O-methyltransferase Ste14
MIYFWFLNVVLFEALRVIAMMIFVPVVTLKRYRATKKNWEHWTMNLCWYSIPFFWFFQPGIPSVLKFILGLTLYAAGTVFIVLTFRDNPFFSPVIEMPGYVVRYGIYSRIRHPGYLGMSMISAGWLGILGHPIGLIPALIYTLLIACRVYREEKLLGELSYD